MKVFLLVLILSISAYAQERQVNVEAQFVTSNGIGDKAGGGLKFELVLPFGENFTGVVESSVLSEPKGYVGSNIGVRTRIDLRVSPFHGKYKPFGSVGFSNTYQRNADYSKSVSGVTYGAGYNFNNRFVPYWRSYVYRDDLFQSSIRGNEFTLPMYLPLSRDQRWHIKASISYVRSSFEQTAGTGKGKYVQSSLLGGLGIGWKF